MTGAVLDWLLAGDPTIRWQAKRDLLDAPEADWKSERARMETEGDGGRLVALENSGGGWGEGIYAPKWTSTTYTLLLMRDMGFDATCAAAARGGQILLNSAKRSTKFGGCTCMVGMFLALGLRFAPGDPVCADMAAHLLTQQMPDGGWNCRWPRVPKTHHSSFHTTLNVLDGVSEALSAGIGPTQELKRAEGQAIELLLQHGMFRSDKTGAVINPKFVELHFPYRWHFDVLRGLDSIRSGPSIKDPRLDEAFEVVFAQRRPDGRWPAAKTYGGKVHFNLELGREGSRWNTLRALRCLKARES